ncbi:MAG: pyruvate formate-lyase-activating protein [Arachnia propionica]|uniref:pyruvate formate-lyase-activating protein n=1 Tax=Arachnia propionica TaxID=1750 RepID=UPI0026FA7969|nr:pyruvate formate-lyase-activating protein [Arachnia propionica]
MTSPAVDGVSGEFRLAPTPLGLPRLRPGGAGTAGIDITDDLERPKHLALVRDGRLASMHSWELVTGVDGPGTRMTVFLSGCPLRCLYCHNPDTMFAAKGQPVHLTDLVGRLRRYRGIFRTTGGGLTISGGEPLMQPAFVARLLREAKELGIHTAVDTSGFLGANASDSLLDDVDLVLLDIKSGIPETHRRVTGRDLGPTLEFARRLGERGSEEVWVRFVLVPGLTDAVENIEAVADVVSQLPVVTRVEVLPFHQMGRDKWASLGLPYDLADTSPPSQDLVDRVREQFRTRGLTAL